MVTSPSCQPIDILLSNSLFLAFNQLISYQSEVQFADSKSCWQHGYKCFDTVQFTQCDRRSVGWNSEDISFLGVIQSKRIGPGLTLNTASVRIFVCCPVARDRTSLRKSNYKEGASYLVIWAAGR